MSSDGELQQQYDMSLFMQDQITNPDVNLQQDRI
jgi:hypothetical protein